MSDSDLVDLNVFKPDICWNKLKLFAVELYFVARLVQIHNQRTGLKHEVYLEFEFECQEDAFKELELNICHSNVWGW